MDIDSRIERKMDELSKIKNEIDKLELIHEVKLGEPLQINTPEEILQSGELHIMEDIAIGELNELWIEKYPRLDGKPLTWKKFLELKKRELEEYREMIKKDGYNPTSFKYE